MKELILIDQTNNVATITFNRPEKKNALSKTLLHELHDAIVNLNNCKAIILTGSESCFSAGADLDDLTGTIADIKFDDLVKNVILAMQQSPATTVSYISGPCMGAAADIALNCDYQIAMVNAYIQIPATKLSLLYNPEGIKNLHACFSSNTLERLLVLGEKINSHEAYQYKLFSYLIPVKEMQNIPDTSANRVEPSKLNNAAKATLELLNTLDDGTFDLQYWNKKREQILNSPERLDAIKAAQK